MYQALVFLFTLCLSTLVAGGKTASKVAIPDSNQQRGSINTKCHGFYINGERAGIAGERMQRPVGPNGQRLPTPMQSPNTPQSLWATCDRRVKGMRTSKLDMNLCLGWHPTAEELVPQSRGNGITKGACGSCYYTKPNLVCLCSVKKKQDDRIIVNLDKVVEATHDGFLACFENTGTQVAMG
ncbi:hypothetical protein BDV26DRAFT_295174 [Aspergillus bertholletiae]|uniref:Cyanovirin-N domain-containing protein n=1 Tax=Aspergillus bertholletiae TaxID=1226010 RepID=A0A5N7B1N3_9EURO|nr:hypothetical protein BDV26DRAFT_295174 [Aspergillus bertholletiae]